MEESDNSRDNKRKKYLDKMMVEENELDYLKRSEVGLISTDEEDNNNSMENSNSIEENLALVKKSDLLTFMKDGKSPRNKKNKNDEIDIKKIKGIMIIMKMMLI